MVFATDFNGKTDSDILQNAVDGRGADGIVIIGPRPGKAHWLLDRAILLPGDTTVVLQNCKLKLSDRCRDNFFRSANCGLGIADPQPLQNIHIRGEGLCILEGADHPRATDDGGKLLHAPCPHLKEDLCKMADWIPPERRTVETMTFFDVHDHSYGTDANDPKESHYGDWRGIGVLFANVKNFSVSGLKVVRSHGWGLSFEACTYGRIEKIEFDATMYQEIDGIKMNMENQDGIDIRNVIAHSYLCYVIRVLPADTHIYNVVIDGIINTSPNCHAAGDTVNLGSSGGYGEALPDGLRNVTVSNVICRGRRSVHVYGHMLDSVISNVVNLNPACEAVSTQFEDSLQNVSITNAVTIREE
ncbi:MAG: hypothetical protein IJ043_00125 [Clostridia bacterium]|nr:hypothetical protein [Clostridia bacterium]